MNADQVVILRGNVYYQKDIKLCGSSKEDTCYWCTAYRNMSLCDLLCGHCNLSQVFVKQTKKEVRHANRINS